MLDITPSLYLGSDVTHAVMIYPKYKVICDCIVSQHCIVHEQFYILCHENELSNGKNLNNPQYVISSGI